MVCCVNGSFCLNVCLYTAFQLDVLIYFNLHSIFSRHTQNRYIAFFFHRHVRLVFYSGSFFSFGRLWRKGKEMRVRGRQSHETVKYRGLRRIFVVISRTRAHLHVNDMQKTQFIHFNSCSELCVFRFAVVVVVVSCRFFFSLVLQSIRMCWLC